MRVMEASPLQREIELIAADLARAHPRRVGPRRLEDAAMASLGQRPQIQTALFRLVDVAPACRSAEDVGAHLVALLADPPQSALVRPVARIGRSRAGRRVLGLAAAVAVRRTARRFIIAETPERASGELGRLWRSGVAHSLDLLGELTVTSDEADGYARRCLQAIEALARLTADWPRRPRAERDASGPIARANLSVKVSALTALQHAEAPERVAGDVRPRLLGLLRAARDAGVHLHVDMESFDWREATMALMLELLSEPEFRAGPSVGLVVQAYLTDSGEQLRSILALSEATARELPLTVRLVKGAYWDHEVVDAGLHGWSSPVWTDKRATDRQFELLTRALIDAAPAVRPAIASHNLRSVAHALAYARAAGLGDGEIEFQILRGLGDDLQEALRRSGLRVRAYCPVGDLIAGMAYLVRRLLENSSNDSFLVRRSRGADLGELLVAP